MEKLSAKAPDGPTKVKILMAIAEEHNVVWEAQSFVESDPKDTELLVSNNNISELRHQLLYLLAIVKHNFYFASVLEWSKLISASE